MRGIFPIDLLRRSRHAKAAENPADAHAAEWIARLDRSGTEEGDHPELQRWLAEDSRHRGAFVRAQAMWRMLDVQAAAPSYEAPVRDSVVTRRALAAGLSACLVGGATLIALGWPGRAEATMLRTGFGEIRPFALPGGGKLVLDGASMVAFRDEDGPRLDLLAGGAWIERAGEGAALHIFDGGLHLALSTASLALRRAPQAEAIVANGFVDLLSGDAQATRLGAGARARKGADAVTHVDQLSPATLDRMLAWRTGDIDLDGESVRAAAERFNLYNRRRIVVDDPRLAAEQVVGRFTLHRPEDFAEAVAAMFGGEVHQGDTIIRLGRAKKT